MVELKCHCLLYQYTSLGKVHQASTSAIGIPQFLYMRILSIFWAPLPIFGLQYFLRKIIFRLKVLASIKPAPQLYENLNKFIINCNRILGIFGLWKSPKINFQNPPLCPKKQPSFIKISPPKIKVYQNFRFFLGSSKMSLSIFGLQPLASKFTPA